MKTTALVLLVGAVLFTSWRWGSFVAGGSDSSCYAIQAVRWAEVLARPLTASLQVPDPLAVAAPWPDAAATFAPTGHVASPVVNGAFVPICPAGLSLVMAPLYLVGGAPLMFVAVPLFGVALVLGTYSLGARFSPRAGVTAALLVAASPVFLYQVVQPMSDVPAAALWMAAVVWATGTRRYDAMFAGLAASGAILMRPNLVPLGFGIGMYLLLRPERTWRQRIRAAMLYAAAPAVGCLVVARIQQQFYGSPLASGYGSFAALFSADHVVPNVRRYASWLWVTQTPGIGLAALAPFLVPGPLALLLLGSFAVNLLLFLPYVVFDDWSFVRFLLPTVPFLLVLVAAVLDSLFARVIRTGLSAADPSRRRQMALAMAVVAIVVAGLMIERARAGHAFELREMEARFAEAGRFVARRLPANALIITDYESGSVRFYSGRRTLAWRSLDAAWLDRAVTYVRDQGFEPYLLFERWEEPEFRSRFAASTLGALDWPPTAEVATQVRIYRVSDRDRYRAGEAVATEYAR